MEIKKTLILSLLFISCYYQKLVAFDIISMLSPYPDFSTFSSYLNQAQIVSDINSRQSITVLAVDNGGMGSLSGNGVSVLKVVMSIHVLLDYFDASKFRTMAGGSTLTPTLYQTTGQAAGQRGFVNMTITSGGAVLFGSGDGSSPRASLVKMVVAQPYNISVLQISGIIFPQGIDNGAGSGSGSGSGSTPPPPPPPPVTTVSPPSVLTNSTTSPPVATTNSTAPPSPVTNSTTPSTTPVTNSTTPTPPATNSTTPPSPTTTASPPSPTNATPPSKSNSNSPADSPSVKSPSPKTAPSTSPTVAPTTDLASAPAPAPLAESDKAGAVRFDGVSGGLILMIVAITTWLNLG